ncbi:MAG: hypothetical protein ACM3OH_06590 [Bacillota bacterium]|jgi:hypothetical protein
MRVFRLRMAALLPIMSTVLIAGCGGRVIHIESDTSWSGTIDGIGAVSGRGSTTFALDAVSSPVCWTITKLTAAGTLRVYSEASTWFGLGEDIEAEQTTTEPNGDVTGCVK